MTLTRLITILGPGIIWAATSVGVSHIVQSTRAGADFAFSLLGFILLAHVIKYPFFLFGPRYAALTGKSLLEGYKAVGNWAFFLFLLLTFITMFFVMSGVTIVTAALATNLFGNALNVSQWSGILLSLIVFLLVAGRYQLLSKITKLMMVTLVLFSILACMVAAAKLGIPATTTRFDLDLTAPATIAFVVALMGWMPTSIEVSVWHSLWTLARQDTPGEQACKEAQLDFNIGYLVTFILAILFVCLGALLMFGQGQGFSNSAAVFAGQLVNMYSLALGDWSWMLMAVITFIALFSTTLAVADGFPMVWQRAYAIIGTNQSPKQKDKVFVGCLLLLAIVSWWIISYHTSNIKTLLDFVTTVSFVAAPVYAWLNYKVMCHDGVAEKNRPSGMFKLYTLTCLLLMTLFSVFFIYWRFF